MDFRERLNRKTAGRCSIERLFEGPQLMCEGIGLTFHFEKITRATNTMLSHCLIKLSPAGKVDAVIDDVYDAYFEHGQDIGNIEVLLEIAKRQGMDVQALQVRIQEAQTKAWVQEQVQQAYW